MAIIFNPFTGNFDFTGAGASGDITGVTAGTGLSGGGNTGAVTLSIASGGVTDTEIAANAEIAVSKLANGTARQLLQTASNGTGVEWTSNVEIPGTLTVTGDTTLPNQSDLRFGEATANGSNYVGFQGPANIASNITWTLPAADGTNGQFLSTNGSGTLAWASASSSGSNLFLYSTCV